MPGLPPSYVTVADKAVQAGEALRALADDAGIAQTLAVIVKAGDVYRVVQALDEAPAGIDPAVFLPELGRRLFELLLGQQLLAEAPRWFATLEALGIIVLEDTPETDQRPGFTRLRFDWDQIPELLADPTLVPARVYGWGTPELRFDKLAELVGQLVTALGLPASLDRLSPELAAALQADASAPPARPARRRAHRGAVRPSDRQRLRRRRADAGRAARGGGCAARRNPTATRPPRDRVAYRPRRWLGVRAACGHRPV